MLEVRLQLLLDVLVTRQTQIAGRTHQLVVLLATVGSMASRTLPLANGRVNAGGSLDAFGNLRVALRAGGPLVLDLLSRQVAPVRVVTRQTHTGLKRHVELGSLETLLQAGVTVKAKLSRLASKLRRLIAGVGSVTRRALALSKRGMDKGPDEPIPLALVTLEAYLVGPVGQEVLESGPMRIVTLYTLIPREGTVDHLHLLLFENLTMAAPTELGTFYFKVTFIDRGVGIMAHGAFTRLNGLVGEPGLYHLIALPMALEA
jgi:hypothetical protein